MREQMVTGGLVLLVAGSAWAQDVRETVAAPAFDRWMYAFGQSPGTRSTASLFSVLGAERFQCPVEQYPTGCFDSRDAQFLVGFDTGGVVPVNRAPSEYRVRAVRLVLRVTSDSAFVYDPTFDALETYLDTDPEPAVYTPADPDAGRPIEVHAVGYRGGWSRATYGESSPYSNGSPLPNKGQRNAFPAQYDAAGQLVDVSNNVDQIAGVHFESRPLAVGEVEGVGAGASVPGGASMVFDFDLANPDAVRYLRESLAAGRVNLIASTLLPVSGPSDPTFAAFYTREFGGAGTAPRLELDVCVGPPGDWNCSGTKGVDDIFAFLADWFSGRGDFNGDGATRVDDIFAFLGAWFA